MHPVMVEWAYAREILRCLGFLPDELFFSVSKSSVISLVLKAQDKEFTWVIGAIKVSPDDLVKAYEELCKIWNDGDAWDVRDFRASRPFQQKETVVKVLRNKGFVLPIDQS